VRGALFVGTSGWSYASWEGPFYPEHITSAERFACYAESFSTVEINNTFYQLPDEVTIRAWRDQAPDGFVYAVKGSRYITHQKKLNDPAEPVANFLERISLLGPTLGPVLFQLPPNWHADPARLDAFLHEVGTGFQPVLEFRDPTWFDDAVYEVLQRHDAALCIYDDAGETSPKELTADFVYLRFHGTEEGYRGPYGREGLAPWAGAVNTWLDQGKDVYAYFNNDADVSAPRDARILKEMFSS
jgi:uncharacterized protein YecE (DUF72 family)